MQKFRILLKLFYFSSTITKNLIFLKKTHVFVNTISYWKNNIAKKSIQQYYESAKKNNQILK